MKEINGRGAMLINSYLTKNGVGSVSVFELLSSLCSGRTQYDVEALTGYIASALLDMFSQDKLNEKKLEKYFVLLNDIGTARYNIMNNPNNKDDDTDFDELIKSRLELAPSALKDFYERTGQEFNEDIYNRLVSIVEKFGATLAVDEEKGDEKKAQKILDLSTRVKELEKANAELNAELAKTLKDYQKSTKQSAKEATDASNKFVEQAKTISDLEKRINELTSQISEFNVTSDDVRTLEELLKEKQSEFDALVIQKDAIIADLESKVSEISLENETILKSDAYVIGSQEIIDRALDEFLLSLLVTESYTALELYNAAKEKFNVTQRDVYDSLTRIQRIVNIKNPNLVSIPPKFGVFKPSLSSNKRISVPVLGNVKKIIFVSDFHVNPDWETDDFKLLIDGLQDYAHANGVNTIINLGDFFGAKGTHFGYAKDYMGVSSALESLFESLNNSEVFDPTISHVLLGGNHDAALSCYGFDPINKLGEAIPSIIPVGYNNATVKLGDGDKGNVIGIHHGGAPKQTANNTKAFVAGIMNFLNNYYKVDSLNKNVSYFDFFGHVHTSVIDPIHGYSTVASLTRDRVDNGAIEADIYFDNNGAIDYMVLYNLTLNENKLKKSAEIPVVR